MANKSNIGANNTDLTTGLIKI